MPGFARKKAAPRRSLNVQELTRLHSPDFGLSQSSRILSTWPLRATPHGEHCSEYPDAKECE